MITIVITIPFHSYDDLMQFMKGRSVISTTKRCLQRLHFLATFRHGSPPNADMHQVPVKIFLCAFVVAYRPSKTFDSMGKLELKLQDAALRLVEMFEGMVRCVATEGSFQAVPFDLSMDFPSLVLQYFEYFYEWKAVDEDRIGGRIKHSLGALFMAEKQIASSVPEQAPLRLEIRTQIERLESKLRSVIGPEKFQHFRANIDAASRCSSPSLRILGARGVDGSVDPVMTNDQLVHELLLAPAFQLDDSGRGGFECPIQSRLRQRFNTSFWESIYDDFRLATPCYVRVLRVLTEIRDGLAELVCTQHVRFVHEVIDIELIDKRLEEGVFSWEHCKRLFGGIVSIIRRAQAPKRDTETNERWNELSAQMSDPAANDLPRIMTEALRFVFERMAVMRVDSSNARCVVFLFFVFLSGDPCADR